MVDPYRLDTVAGIGRESERLPQHPKIELPKRQPLLPELGRQEIAREEDRHATLKSQMKSSLQALEAKRNRLASVVASSTEYREVTVELLADFPSNAAVEIRADTGEELTRRLLVDSERQQFLPIEPGPDDLGPAEATS